MFFEKCTFTYEGQAQGLPLPVPEEMIHCILCLYRPVFKNGCCLDCQIFLKPIKQPACQYCATPLPTSSVQTCGSCNQNLPDYQRLIVGHDYWGAIRYFIGQLKFKHRLAYANILGDCCLNTAENFFETDRPEAIIPMPLHKNRLRVRGFNQTERIARVLEKKTNLPIENHLLMRIRPTPSQRELKKEAREKNMKNAFTCKPTQLRSVILFDDVFTTGATVRAASRCLKKAGIEKIMVWCCARTE